ncbi:MAG: IS110 family transposase [Pseudomonadota bacterium]
MKLATIGVDLTPDRLQVHGVDEHGQVLLRRQLPNAQVLAFFAMLKPCLIGMKACGNAHFWARKLIDLGHTVKLMVPQFVKAHTNTDSRDAVDAQAICAAVSRPDMHFVPVKSPAQQAALALHRTRQVLLKSRSEQSTQLRGLLLEFGIVIPGTTFQLLRKLPDALQQEELPASARHLLQTLYGNLQQLEDQITQMEAEIRRSQETPRSRQAPEEKQDIEPVAASAPVVRQRPATETLQEQIRRRLLPLFQLLNRRLMF